MIIDKATGAVHLGKHTISVDLTQSGFLAAMNEIIDHAQTRHYQDSATYIFDTAATDQIRATGWLTFHGETLHHIGINFYTIDYDFNLRTPTGQYLTRLLNDSILRANLGEPHESTAGTALVIEGERVPDITYNYEWGTAFSGYDGKGGVLMISISYQRPRNG